MIKKVRLRYFKMFKEMEFDLSERIILAGPNNSGKTTLLQAIAVWNLGLRRWIDKRGPESKVKDRTGVPITRKDFTAIPLREMKLLWFYTLTSLKKDEIPERPAGTPRAMEITLEGKEGENGWKLTLEFRYQGSEQIYVKPSEDTISDLQRVSEQFSVVHVPPFSGIGAEETIHTRPYQELLVGQGKPGDILRNLLVEVHQQDNENWEQLRKLVEEIFGYRLLPPQYEGKPFILCEYLQGIPKGLGKGGFPQLDLASAGSGFHQILMLLAFFYGRPSSVLLFDEPDAHLHVILQKQIYDRLRQIAAKRRCQLIIATHSEVLIDNTSPDSILSFYREPHRLTSDIERDRVAEALKRLTATDLLLAEHSLGILYVEGETDFNLLRHWARASNHPLKSWFEDNPFWHINQGRDPREAKGHFFALKAINPKIKGFLLLDGDNRGLPDREVVADGLFVGRWERYEAENYLIHPVALLRFIEEQALDLFYSTAENYLKEQLPPIVWQDPLQSHEFLKGTPASKTLLPEFFRKADLQISKKEYFLIVDSMKPEEIAPEVIEKLNDIQRALGFQNEHR